MLACSIAKGRSRRAFMVVPPLWRVSCLYAPSATQPAQVECDSVSLERINEFKYCIRVQHFELKMCLQWSDTVRGKSSREFLLRMQAVSTTLYRCLVGFTIVGTVRGGMQLHCSVQKISQNCRTKTSDGIILQ